MGPSFFFAHPCNLGINLYHNTLETQVIYVYLEFSI